MRQRIVIIDDEKDIIELIRYNFTKENFEVVGFLGGRSGLEYLHRSAADLVLLDILLPDLDGMEVCRRLRADEHLKRIPVVFLTAKDQEADRILGLEIGADDYVMKPFSPRELVARVRAVLRSRSAALETPEVIEAGELHLDRQTHEATVAARPLQLTALEFKLLYFLAARPRQVFSRDRLLDEVWGRDRFVTPRTVDVHVCRLRQKIGSQADGPNYLQAIRGVGYRFSADKP